MEVREKRCEKWVGGVGTVGQEHFRRFYFSLTEYSSFIDLCYMISSVLSQV